MDASASLDQSRGLRSPYRQHFYDRANPSTTFGATPNVTTTSCQGITGAAHGPDNKTPRPNRYIMLDFAEPIGGVDVAAFEAALSKRVTEVLALPGWMAVQPFRLATPPAVDARPHLPSRNTW